MGRATALGEIIGVLGAHQVDRAPGPAAPRELAPQEAGGCSAASIRASSSVELFSKSSRLDACEADISRPNATTRCVFRASTPWRTRSFSLRTWRARFYRPGRDGPIRLRAGRASPRRAGTRGGGGSFAEEVRDSVALRAPWSYMPSASRREVLESHTTIAGAGLPSGSLSWINVSQSRKRA